MTPGDHIERVAGGVNRGKGRDRRREGDRKDRRGREREGGGGHI